MYKSILISLIISCNYLWGQYTNQDIINDINDSTDSGVIVTIMRNKIIEAKPKLEQYYAKQDPTMKIMFLYALSQFNSDSLLQFTHSYVSQFKDSVNLNPYYAEYYIDDLLTVVTLQIDEGDSSNVDYALGMNAENSSLACINFLEMAGTLDSYKSRALAELLRIYNSDPGNKVYAFSGIFFLDFQSAISLFNNIINSEITPDDKYEIITNMAKRKDPGFEQVLKTHLTSTQDTMVVLSIIRSLTEICPSVENYKFVEDYSLGLTDSTIIEEASGDLELFKAPVPDSIYNSFQILDSLKFLCARFVEYQWVSDSLKGEIIIKIDEVMNSISSNNLTDAETKLQMLLTFILDNYEKLKGPSFKYLNCYFNESLNRLHR